MTAQLEYAVGVTSGGDTTIVPVGDEVLMRQTVAEFLERGDDVEPLTRTVTDWHVDEAALTRARRDVAHENVLHIAQIFWEGEIDEATAVADLRPYAPQMSDHDRAELLGELVSELEHQEDVENRRRVTLAPGQDWQELEDDAERRVREAANALIDTSAQAGAK